MKGIYEMKTGVLTALIICSMFAQGTRAHDTALDILPIDHVLTEFAARNGVKFSVDPRVRGSFHLAGIKLEELTVTQLQDMLMTYHFIALIKNDIVYITPRGSYDRAGSDLGEIWRE